MKRMGLVILAMALLLLAQAAQGQWLASQRLTWSPEHSSNAAIAVDANNRLHVVWSDATPGNDEIYYKKSTDAGTTWTTSQRLTWTSTDSEYPAIAVDASGHLHVVWDDDMPGNHEIYYKKSTDGGATWTGSQRLTWDSSYSTWPAIAVSSPANLYLAWQDYASGNGEIYHKKSTDGGTTWTTSQRLTWNSGSSGYPAIAVSSTSNISVVWEDDTPGNYEIYYKKSTNGGTTWTTSRRLTWTSGYCDPASPSL
jgi:predicted neuraminidase